MKCLHCPQAAPNYVTHNTLHIHHMPLGLAVRVEQKSTDLDPICEKL